MMSYHWSSDDPPTRPKPTPVRGLTDAEIARLVRRTAASERDRLTLARPRRGVDWAVLGLWSMYAVGILVALVIVYAVYKGWR